MFRSAKLLLLALLAGSVDGGNSSERGSSSGPVFQKKPAAQALQVLPLRFEPNRGQADKSFSFVSRGSGYNLQIAASEAELSLGGRAIRMRLDGANSQAKAAAGAPLPGIVNYQIGDDPEHWQIGVPTFGRVQFEDVYPGVNLLYYGADGSVEYDFVVTPGSDPGVIALQFDGAENLAVNGTGDLLLRNTGGTVIMRRPVIYQEDNGIRRQIDGRYRIHGDREARFEVEQYDRTRPLTIDPVLTYSTYLGGANNDVAQGIAVDAAGNAYVVGQTSSANFPAVSATPNSIPGGRDVFVTKFSPTGSVLFSSYFGGSGDDDGLDIAVDSSGNSYITGATDSTTLPAPIPFPTIASGNGDAFLVTLNSNGTLTSARFIGGSGKDTGNTITLDSAANIYIGGMTQSTDFPVARTDANTNGDGFVIRMVASGGVAYATVLGGTREDAVTGIAVDSAGSAYAVGTTTSLDFPTVNPIQRTWNGGIEIFLTRLSPTGQIVSSTYYGGAGDDIPKGVAIDLTGVYIVGSTTSLNFPVVRPLQASNAGGTDAFVMKYTGQISYATYLGGPGDDTAYAVSVDSAAHAYVAGSTSSTNLPVINAFQNASGGASDGFIAQFAQLGTSLMSFSYFGGSADDVISGIVVDSSRNAYVAGFTSSGNLPVTSAVQANPSGAVDAFVAVFPEGNFRPPNDDIANATGITGGSGSSGGTNIGATVENKEPVRGGRNSVWWRWTPTFTGTVTMDTKGSDFDTVLTVFRGNDISSLIAVASNDDASDTDRTSLVTFQVADGVTYYISVTGTNDASGNIRLNWSTRVVPITGQVVIGGFEQIVPAAAPQSASVRLSQPYPLQIDGQLTLSFGSDSAAPVDDPAIQFLTGGRTVDFTIPANSLQAVFPGGSNLMGLQTGTVSGVITLRTTLSSLGSDITPVTPAPPQAAMVIARAAPTVTNVTITPRDDTNFDITITGFSTLRQITQANFTFTPAPTVSIQQAFVQVDLSSVFNSWYVSPASSQFGSQFVLRVPFSLGSGKRQGLSQVSVSLANSIGTSGTVVRPMQ